ncbi:MAG TPA: FAD-dependent oxidoreductase, partial [Paraburkholderia sp.]|uniref:NAD(P)/FAD-dependent oxidoreductase n=1 Tax=Paraburkholderia sp. TaxID=1926495 RepID=UPI002CB96940
MHRFIVVGGGAGGLELATRLGDRYGEARAKRGRPQAASVTLVDRNPTHIWKPLLHEVAAGSMDPFTHQLEYAAQARWHGFEFQQGELVGLDRAAKRITLGRVLDEDGAEMLPERVLEYDTLVLSIGSTTHFFGVPGAAENSIALDTVEQAERFRKRLIAACMRAEHQAPEAAVAQGSTGGAEPRVQVAIIGAGATGVELSAELRNTAQVLSAYGLHKLDPR